MVGGGDLEYAVSAGDQGTAAVSSGEVYHGRERKGRKAVSCGINEEYSGPMTMGIPS